MIDADVDAVPEFPHFEMNYYKAESIGLLERHWAKESSCLPSNSDQRIDLDHELGFRWH
jgi:hypothetical protein